MSLLRAPVLIYSIGCIATVIAQSQIRSFSKPVQIVGQPKPMFSDITNDVFRLNPSSNPVQLNYGVAVTDVDNDGELEIIVAGYNGPNLVLKYNKETSQLVNMAVDDPTSPYYALRDPNGNAIGVAACDVDGDGKEEIYFLNTNQAYSGLATYSDKLFKYRNGKYEDLLSDSVNKNIASFFAGRSVACVDRDGSGRYGIYLANYASGRVRPHSLIEMDPTRSDVGRGIVALRNVGSEVGIAKFTGTSFEDPSPVRTVIAADFDNDGRLEVFFNNIAYRGVAPNRLFQIQNQSGSDPNIVELDIGDALEPQGRGTGGAVTDFNGDGKLELIVSHGESAMQPLSIYKVNQGTENHFMRVMPKTQFGAPARGARVTLVTTTGKRHLRIIDGGSGYLCQMEPVAHFGLGDELPESLEITWPDTSKVNLNLTGTPPNRQLIVEHPNKETISRQDIA